MGNAAHIDLHVSTVVHTNTLSEIDTVNCRENERESYRRDGSCSAGLRTGTQRTKADSAQSVHWEFTPWKGRDGLCFLSLHYPEVLISFS